MTLHMVKVIKLVSLMFCIALFCLLMSDIYEKFSKKMTSVGVTIEEYDGDKKDLPCFTLCPWKVFRKPGFHFKLEDFQQNTYNESEIFTDQPQILFVDKSLYTVEAVNNIFVGQCFMTCFLQPGKKMMQNYFLLQPHDHKGKKNFIKNNFVLL